MSDGTTHEPLTTAPPPGGAADVKPSAFRLPTARDARVGFGQGWVLIAGMVCLAAVFLGIVWNTAPRAWRGWVVGAGVAAAVFFLLAPAAAVFTRRLYKRRRRREPR
jgi:hypothetical protein